MLSGLELYPDRISGRVLILPPTPAVATHAWQGPLLLLQWSVAQSGL